MALDLCDYTCTLSIIGVAQPWALICLYVMWRMLGFGKGNENGGSAEPQRYQPGSPTELAAPLVTADVNNAILTIIMIQSGKRFEMDIGHSNWEVVCEALLNREWNCMRTITTGDRSWTVHGLLLRHELIKLGYRGSAIAESTSTHDMTIEGEFGDLVFKADNILVNRLSGLSERFDTSPIIEVTCSANPSLSMETRRCVVDACLRETM